MPQNFEETMILSPSDMPPLEIINRGGICDIVLTCEHAGQLIPSCLGNLGIKAEEMSRHIAYDIGAAPLSRLLAAKLDAPLFIQRYSRLVIDCNRPFSSPTLIPPVSDGTIIPANQELTSAQRQLRFNEIHQAFHNPVGCFIEERRQSGRAVILVSVHSFTRQLRMEGKRRSLSLGLLFNRDRRLADALLAQVNREHPDIKAALNEPYSISDEGDYTIPIHGEAGGIAHILLEVVNDEIEDAACQTRWCDILAPLLIRAAAEIK